MSVGCVVVQVDDHNGGQREHCVRDDQVISQLHLRLLFLHRDWSTLCEVDHQLFCHVGQTDCDGEHDEDDHGQTGCEKEIQILRLSRGGGLIDYDFGHRLNEQNDFMKV